jgi:hypothetical protein
MRNTAHACFYNNAALHLHTQQHAQETALLMVQASSVQEESLPRGTLARLQSELHAKDERLGQLRSAIKTLESKLHSVLRDRADM